MQGHPLLKLLHVEDMDTVSAESELEQEAKSVVVVGTYNDMGPNYYTVRFFVASHK